MLLKRLDLSSLESVRDFADDINRTESRLDVLIHNAGVANTFGRKTTAEGLELTMATNQYGPFLLTHLLISESPFFNYGERPSLSGVEKIQKAVASGETYISTLWQANAGLMAAVTQLGRVGEGCTYTVSLLSS